MTAFESVCDECKHSCAMCSEAGCVADSVIGDPGDVEAAYIITQAVNREFAEVGYLDRIFRTSIESYADNDELVATFGDGSVLVVPLKDAWDAMIKQV
jgi:hypothetical protein